MTTYTKCRAVRVVGICGNAIEDNGVNGEGFCQDCWTSDLAERHELYRQFREEGSSREEAIELADIIAPDSKIKNTSIIRNEKPHRAPGYMDHVGIVLDGVSKEVAEKFHGFSEESLNA
jgi:hypothetical protein